MRCQLLFALLAFTLVTPGRAAAEDSRQWRDPLTEGEFVLVAAGCFAMGADRAGPLDLKGAPQPPRADELPRHRVCVSEFWIGRHEVTERVWQTVMGKSLTAPAGNRPVVNVSREDVLSFINHLNRQSASGDRYRLPTEAEWEFACLPGEPTGAFDDRHGKRMEQLAQTTWFRYPRRDDPATRNVGEMKANPLGLHDMLGNVWEWVEDNYRPDAYAAHAENNPVIRDKSERWVLRGGSFKSDVDQVRCGARAHGVAGDRLPTVGFRLIRVPKKLP